jgi:hypothetical protein
MNEDDSDLEISDDDDNDIDDYDDDNDDNNVKVASAL